MISSRDLGKFLSLGSLERAPTTGQSNGWSSNPRLVKRVGFGVIGFILSITLIAGLVRLTPSTEYVTNVATQYFHSQDPTDPLVALDAKYRHLRDDKFTIAMQTYQRPHELNETLTVLTSEKIPSLHEIVIVWNNLDQPTPPDFVSQHGVPVRYRMSTVNSLNQKLIPDPAYETKAVLLTDDDVYYRPDDLEWVFHSWRSFGQYRLVGALPRCADVGADGKWKYSFCSNDDGQNRYALILTNLCFANIAYLDYYSSEAPVAVKIREYVDEHFNCEDIALNFLASNLTGYGPLEANGFKGFNNMHPSGGISTKPGHLEARSKCINDFADMFGYMPLVNETSHIVRGLTVIN